MIKRIKDFLGDDIKRGILFLVFGGISLFISLIAPDLPINAAWIAIIFCGIPIIKEAVVGLVTEFDIKADVLVSLALIASVCIGEIFAAGEVAFIMQIGGLLEEITVAKARAGLEKLVHLTPRTARVLYDGTETVVDAEQVKVNDILRVLPGETIPVDGVILDGETSVNQAALTGESMPVDKHPGDEVSSGTVNQFGAFLMKATKVGEDSSIQRMIRLVQSADASKAKIVGLADRWATWIVVTALTAAIVTFLVTHEILRSVTILVVFCPCALVLATPTAIMAAIGNATKRGVLVREGDALERLAKVKRVTFDKTGTLTYGKPKVLAVHSTLPEIQDEKLYYMVACAEQRSEHPLGKAIIKSFRTDHADYRLSEPESFTMLPGKGVAASIEGMQLLAGNTDLLMSRGVTIAQEQEELAQEYAKKGCTITYVAVGQKFAGFIALSDTIRESAASMISELQKINVTPVLLTGDNDNAAQQIAQMLGIRDVHSKCLPEDKLRYIKEYQESGEPVCMIGDGINDAPALKTAQVGIAMGGIGSDIAVEAADIALVHDEIGRLPQLMRLARKMMSTINLNIAFSLGLNFLAIILAITGIMNPVVGALVHNAGSVAVIINSALLLNWQGKRKKPADEAQGNKGTDMHDEVKSHGL